MEMLNRIQVRGIVGCTKTISVGNKTVVQFSLATQYAYRSADGGLVIDTTWFPVTATEGKGVKAAKDITKGAAVEVTGRMRTYRFTDRDGNDRTAQEIVARNVTVLGLQSDLCLTPEEMKDAPAL